MSIATKGEFYMVTAKHKNNKKEQVKIVHTIPIMSDEERTKERKKMGNELYKIFKKICEEFNIESEKQKN